MSATFHLDKQFISTLPLVVEVKL